MITYKLSTERFEAAFSRKLKKKIASTLGIHLVGGNVLCKLVADELLEAEDEVAVLKALVMKAVPEALGKQVVLEAHCSTTVIVSKQS